MNQQSDVVSLVNISGQKWPPRHRAYFGSLMIQSPEPGEAYAVTPIRGCTSVMDLGDKRTMEIKLSAREIAQDIERELNGDSGEGSFHGVFVAAGPMPTEAELAGARKRLEEFQARLVEAADLEWERSHNLMFITDLERRAARELRLEKPWLYGFCGRSSKLRAAMWRGGCRRGTVGRIRITRMKCWRGFRDTGRRGGAGRGDLTQRPQRQSTESTEKKNQVVG